MHRHRNSGPRLLVVYREAMERLSLLKIFCSCKGKKISMIGGLGPFLKNETSSSLPERLHHIVHQLTMRAFISLSIQWL